VISFIGFIPAREGSVRIPNKNLKLLKKKPLVFYSIKASKNSKYIKETVVFSDSKKINIEAKRFGIKSFYKRPKYLSKKNTPMYETINYFIKKNNIIKKFDYLVLLQPTSPQRSTKDIDNACRMILKDKKADGLVSTFEIKKIRKEYPDKFMIKKGQYLKKINIKKSSKSKKKIYLRNGPAILILKIKAIKKNLYNNKLLNFVMPEKRSIDINTIDDLKKIKKNF
jgi:CMP-N,N'-diacetyllegionaminic acid synthase